MPVKSGLLLIYGESRDLKTRWKSVRFVWIWQENTLWKFKKLNWFCLNYKQGDANKKQRPQEHDKYHKFNNDVQIIDQSKWKGEKMKKKMKNEESE